MGEDSRSLGERKYGEHCTELCIKFTIFYFVVIELHVHNIAGTVFPEVRSSPEKQLNRSIGISRESQIGDYGEIEKKGLPNGTLDVSVFRPSFGKIIATAHSGVELVTLDVEKVNPSRNGNSERNGNFGQRYRSLR